MGKPKKKVTPKPEPKAAAFSISVQIGDKTFKGEGATAHEALAAIQPPHKLMLNGVITIQKGKQSHQVLMNVARLKRLFYPAPSMQIIQAKQLASGFK